MESEINTNGVTDINNACRACISTQNTKYLEDHSKNNLFRNILINLSIPVTELDTPLLLCDSCQDRLNDINNFRDMCLQSHSIIKNLLNKDKCLATDSTDNIGNGTINIEFTDIGREYPVYENENKDDISECLPKINQDEINEGTASLSNAITCIEKEIKCELCGEYFGKAEEVTNNIRTIHGTNDYKCSECKVILMDPALLSEHIKVHEKLGIKAKYACSRCDKSYTSMLNLKIHLYNHTGVKPFRCSTCFKGFTKKSTLIAHLTIHTGNRNFLCNECGKRFTSTVLLNRHTLVHTEHKPFKCDICSGRFISTGDLNIHLRSHTGEKPYLCSTCGKSFSRNIHLTVHRRIHTGEKPYNCGTCGRSFTQSGDLQAHARIHTGEKPYTCTVCKKKFSQSSTLSTHMKTHSGQVFNCEVCLKKFTLFRSLSKHLLSHQKD